MISLVEKYWIRTKFQNDNGILKSISYVNTFIPADTIVIQDKVKNSSHNKK